MQVKHSFLLTVDVTPTGTKKLQGSEGCLQAALPDVLMLLFGQSEMYFLSFCLRALPHHQARPDKSTALAAHLQFWLEGGWLV